MGYRTQSEDEHGEEGRARKLGAALFLMALSVLPVGARPYGEPETRIAAAGPFG